MSDIPENRVDIQVVPGVGWHVELGDLLIEITESDCQVKKGAVHAVLRVSAGGAALHSAPLNLTKPQDRDAFISVLSDKSPGATPPLLRAVLLELERVIAKSTQEASASQQREAGEYRLSHVGLERIWVDGDGKEHSTQLSNFGATIVGEIQEDDGAETQLMLEIEAKLSGRDDAPARFSIGVSEFKALDWVISHLGGKAIVYPGSREHVAVAIQELSGDESGHIPRRHVYTHTGWRQIEGEWVYLHAGGAIAPNGPIKNIDVRLPEALARYDLPDPPQGPALAAAVRASLRLIEVGPDRVTVPTLAAVYRAVLGQADFSPHISGPTQAGKTAFSALAQSHFGPGLDARSLPGSWLSTGNALEALAFAAKDALLVVDDFAPTGSVHDVHRFHREADRVLRAQGNSAGRQRLRSDATFRRTKHPRGTIFSTGEDVPRGQSLRARLFILELGPNDLDWQRLTAAQEDAARGFYAQALAGFVQWLAADYETIRHLRPEIMRLREQALRSTGHRRTPEIVANLAIGWSYWLAYAEDIEAITPEERATLWQRGWTALGQAASVQVEHQEASEPTGRFLEFLRAALASGKAHIANARDGGPPDPQMRDAFGWNSIDDPRSPRIGWADVQHIYLEPEASFAAAQAMARETGEGSPLNSKTLHKRLKERGLLVAFDRKDRTTVRKTIAGQRREVLQLDVATLFPEESDPSDQTASPR